MHPVLIEFGPLALSTYGALVAAAYLVAILWLRGQMKHMPKMNEEKFWVLVYGLFFGAILGGKALFVLVEWRSFANGELSFLRDFRYGFVFFGGLLGAMAMGLKIKRWTGLPYLGTADYFGAALPLGHAIGRLGCLGAGCCYGLPTALPWGLALGGDPRSSTPHALWGVPLHPTQLYEAAWNVALFFFIKKRVLPRVQKGKLPAGSAFLAYIFLYSLGRFVIEFFRGDPRGGGLINFTVSQWISAVGALISAALIWRSKRKLAPVLGL